jgi:hypothetical protein
MLSLIEVKCPHCGAQGQIMLPPLGAIIIGPCPECEGMVVVFCGRVLALDKAVMVDGSIEEKRDHLLEVLARFLHDRIERLFEQQAAESEAGGLGGLEEEDFAALAGEGDEEEMELPHGDTRRAKRKAAVPISQEELDAFLDIDLKLIDNKEYFKAVFE